MPNWCNTRITINHENESELLELERRIQEWSGFEGLENIVKNTGIGTVNTGKETDLDCRGHVSWTQCSDNQLIIDTETAYQPMLKMWVKLLEKYIPDAELIYSAEECGNGIYVTNDPCLENCFVIDCCNMTNMESDWEATEETVRERLQELLNTNETDVERLIEVLRESKYKNDIFVHKWEYEDVSAWD